MTESTLNKEIGQRIKNLRKQQKMTLKEIGAHVGISESTAKRYEDGSIKKHRYREEICCGFRMSARLPHGMGGRPPSGAFRGRG